ncbi:Alpha/beta hydrolase family-domain-containing protein [Schizophyllum amplum]|uniref:Alpha/beta hydrolase family-domain-containing protein n=1 Tax=Schizophyllum amplum TaxID=97359 RepID=A0A550BVA8_9AGAR|nr:Alpha/beta hydrolase family-domain-containing protein [Auriculariopsis ampla]
MTEARRTPLEAQTTVLLEAHTTVLPPDNTYPLFIVGTRYRLPSPHLAAFRHVDPSAPTLVLLHAIGFHKEVWEPTIAALLGAAGPAVQEAWAIECPNHVQSAGYAAAAHRFLENVADLRSRPLVGIGHSLGGIALTILQRIPPLLPFTSLIIVEPVLLAVPRPRIERLRVRLRGRALGRKDAWRTREAAEAYFRKAPWDGRVVDLFVEHGLVRDDRRGGVTLACSREQEETMYMDMYGPTAPLDYLPQMCSDIPVHLVLGSPNDVMAADLHAALLTGRIPWTSVARIPQAGHFVPMDAPDALAVVLAGMLPRIEGLRAPGIQREREQRVHEAYAMEMARREEGAPVVVARL